jgi:predicted Zn-dependent protease
MNKKYLLLNLFFALTFRLLAQDFCRTIAVPKNALSARTSNRMQTVNSSYTVHIYAHVIRDNDGAGGHKIDSVKAALKILMEDFNKQNVCVSLLGINEIRDYALYRSNYELLLAQKLLDSDADGKFKLITNSSYKNPNAIDMYFFESNRAFTGESVNAGLAIIEGKSLAIFSELDSKNVFGTKLLSHELGHCLGLWHTYHGSACEIDKDIPPEFANSSNGETAGDLVLDTPGDVITSPTNVKNDCSLVPIYSRNYCTVLGFTYYKDSMGNDFQPDMTLIMSGTTAKCRKNFTDGQGLRMRKIIASNSLLQDVIAPENKVLENLVISGNKKLVFDATNLLTAGTNIIVNPSSALTLRAGESVVLYPGFLANAQSEFLAEIGCSSVKIINAAKISQIDDYQEDALISRELNFTKIYPNPANNFITLSSNNALTRIILSSIEGKIIRKERISNTTSYDIDINQLSKGIYFISIENSLGEITIRKFIKN